jgi:uncharacterized protein (DUF2384 family)
MPWLIEEQSFEAPDHPEALTDVSQLLNRLVKAFGVRAAARLIGADPSTVANWQSGHRNMSAEMTHRIVDLHDVLSRAFRIFQPKDAVLWLFGSEPFLDGRRPIDVLVVSGAAPLVEALSNIAAGAYA